MMNDRTNRRIAAVVAAMLLCIWLSPWTAAAQPSVSSLSAVIYEPQSGRVLMEKDAHTKRPMASTTKLMTALIGSEAIPADRVVTIPAAAVLVEGSSMGLRAGDTLTMEALLTGLLLVSGNDAANAVALLVSGSLEAFAQRMNEKAAALGMKDTVFLTPSGLDEGEHGSSAYDMALLGAAVMRSESLKSICALKTTTVEVSGKTVWLTNHNKLLKLYEPAVGMKTGFTKKSGKCLVSAAEKDGVLLIAVTLNGGDYWNDHIHMYEYGFSRTRAVPLPAPETECLPVAGGTAGMVGLSFDRPPSVVLIDEEEAVMTVELPPFLLAPVKAGEEVGRAIYRVGDREVCRLSITAAQTIDARPVAGLWPRFLELFGALWEILLR